MIEEFTLTALAAASTAWSVASARRGSKAVARGAATMAAVLGLSAMASWWAFMPWLEGGVGMPVVSLVGSYALASAVASRVSGSRGARWAAAVGAMVTAAVGVFFFRDTMVEIDAILRNVAPRDAELIREGSRGEVMRLLQWSGALTLATLATLVVRPRRGGQLQSRPPLHAAPPADRRPRARAQDALV